MKKYFLIILLVITTTLTAQIERPKWEIGGGARFNYMGLDGGYEGESTINNYQFKMNYKDIGMDNYAPSMAIAFGGRYKKWRLSFAGSRGLYKGEFTTKFDIMRETVQIDSGSVVNGQVEMGIYALTTTFALYQKKHEFGVGIGFLILNMGSTFSSTDVNGQVTSFGSPVLFPMPFIAASGRLNFGDFRISGTGGGAIFIGKKNDLDYDVRYYTIDIKGSYDFYKGEKWSYSVSFGFRKLFMNMHMENESGWVKENDIYTGPYLSLRAKLSSIEKWTYIRLKDRKKNK